MNVDEWENHQDEQKIGEDYINSVGIENSSERLDQNHIEFSKQKNSILG